MKSREDNKTHDNKIKKNIFIKIVYEIVLSRWIFMGVGLGFIGLLMKTKTCK